MVFPVGGFMFAPISTRSPAQARRYFEIASVAARLAALAGLLAMVAACGAVPSAPLAGSDPADPAAPVPRSAYRAAIGPFERSPPVEAGSWREQNERLSPGDKP
jgi:hypothetical protein